jgi:hypothetical protein
MNVTANCEQRGVVVAGDIDGGKNQGGVSLGLPAGETTLEGDKALAFARLRKNECDPSEDDTDRAARQQIVLNGIKGRLTSPTRLPYNFLKGPWIGWNAPKAFISDMGGFTLPQLAIAAIFGGSGETTCWSPPRQARRQHLHLEGGAAAPSRTDRQLPPICPVCPGEELLFAFFSDFRSDFFPARIGPVDSDVPGARPPSFDAAARLLA